MHVSEDFERFLPGQLVNRQDQTYTENRIYLQKIWQKWQLYIELISGNVDNNIYQVVFPEGLAGCDQQCQESPDLTAVSVDVATDYSAGYINLYRHFSHGLTLYVGYGEQIDDNDDKRGKTFERETGHPSHVLYMKQTMVGFRYDFDFHWRFAAMFTHFNGTASLDYASNPLSDHDRKYWHALHVNLSYSF